MSRLAVVYTLLNPRPAPPPKDSPLLGRLFIAMARKKKKPKLPRVMWRIKPMDRIHASKKQYNRQRDKRALERAALLGQWEDLWGAKS